MLDELRANAYASELVHNFDGVGRSGLSLDIALWNATEYLPTTWEMLRLGYFGDPERATFGHPASPQDAAEEGLFKLAPFHGPHDVPADFAEASSRMHYVALNMLRVDAGNPLWGQVTAVFSPSYWEDAVAVAPIDTGIYIFCCNKTYMRTPGAKPCVSPLPENTCASESMSPGVAGAMDHALLAYFAKFEFADMFGKLFAAWHGDSPLNLTLPETFLFMESDILANVLYAEGGIKLLVGAFGPLFGTERGALLRTFASRRGIALAWALGPGLANISAVVAGAASVSFQPDVRILDVSDASELLNASSLAPGSPTRRRAESALADLWAEAADSRRAAGGDANLTRERVSELWAAAKRAVPSDAQIRPPAAWACADWHSCVGATALGDCICYTTRRHFRGPASSAVDQFFV